MSDNKVTNRNKSPKRAVNPSVAPAMCAILIAMLITAAGCPSGQKKAETNAATTATGTAVVSPNADKAAITLNNGVTVKLRQIDSVWKYSVPDQNKMQIISSIPDWKKKIAEQWMLLAAVAEKAKKENINNDTSYKDLLSTVEMQTLAQIYMDKVLKPKLDEVKVTDAELQDYYNKNKETQFFIGWREISQIVVATQKEADDLYTKLSANPAGFEAAAKAKSMDKETGPKGGYLGRVYKDGTNALPEVVTTALKTPKGKVSSPIQTRNGWTIILVKSASPEDYMPFNDQSKMQLQQRVTGEKKKALYDKFTEDLKKEYAPKIDDKIVNEIGDLWSKEMEAKMKSSFHGGAAPHGNMVQPGQGQPPAGHPAPAGQK